MNDSTPPALESTSVRRRSPMRTALLVILGLILILGLITFLLYRYYFKAGRYKPVELNQKEEVVLEQKLDRLEGNGLEVVPEGQAQTGSYDPAKGELEAPEPTTEPKDKFDEMLDEEKTGEEERRIVLTEREANALLAKNTNLAEVMKIRFEQDTVKAAFIIPMDEDLPIVGGKTFRGRIDATARMVDGKFSLVVDKITAMGYKIPQGWAEFQGVDLVSDPEHASPFFKKFASGIKDFRIENGEMVIELAD